MAIPLNRLSGHLKPNAATSFPQAVARGTVMETQPTMPIGSLSATINFRSVWITITDTRTFPAHHITNPINNLVPHSEAARKRLSVCPGGHLRKDHVEYTAIDFQLEIEISIESHLSEFSGMK